MFQHAPGHRCGRSPPHTEESEGEGAGEGAQRGLPHHQHWVNSGNLEPRRCTRRTEQVTAEGGGTTGAIQFPTSTRDLALASF